MMKPHGFSKEQRIRKRGNFLKVQGKGRRIVTKRLVFLLLENETGVARVGLTVSKKVGNAVVRNRIKRMLREAFRLGKPLYGRGIDIVVIPRPALPKRPPLLMVMAEFSEMERRFLQHENKLRR